MSGPEFNPRDEEPIDREEYEKYMENIIRCQSRNKEVGQCELRQGHSGKHLAGYLLWDDQPQLDIGPCMKHGRMRCVECDPEFAALIGGEE